jgi:hypothetical protein
MQWYDSLEILRERKESLERAIGRYKWKIDKAEKSLAIVIEKLKPKEEAERKRLRKEKRHEELHPNPHAFARELETKYERPRHPDTYQRTREYPEYNHLMEKRPWQQRPIISEGYARDYPHVEKYRPISLHELIPDFDPPQDSVSDSYIDPAEFEPRSDDDDDGNVLN